MRRSEIEATSATAIARKSSTYATGAPWKLPLDSTRPSSVITGLSTADDELAERDRAGVVDGVARGAVHLRRAAQRVRVLHARAHGRVAVRRDDRRVGEERAEVRGGCRLPDLRTQRHEVGGEDRIGAELALDRHRGGDVGRVEQHREVVEREQQHPEHAVGAVDEGEALLLAQHERLDAGRGQRVGRRNEVARGVAHVALAHRGERDVRERGEVARAAERAVLADDRGDAGVEHRGVGLHDDRAHAGVAGGERLQAQQLQRAHDLALDLGAGAGGVRADEARLQLGAALGGDERGGERAEAGRDAVVRLGVVGEAFDERAGCRDPRERGGVEFDAGAVAGDGDDVLGAQGCGADDDDVGDGGR